MSFRCSAPPSPKTSRQTSTGSISPSQVLLYAPRTPTVHGVTWLKIHSKDLESRMRVKGNGYELVSCIHNFNSSSISFSLFIKLWI
jgi:hypothetical protein